MTIRVAINGLGRIGRQFLKAASADPAVQLVGINDLGTPENLAYLVRYDSTHGKWKRDVQFYDGAIVIDGVTIPCLSEDSPKWSLLKADYVVECSGRRRDFAAAGEHLASGAQRVVISAPTTSPTQVPTIVMGVNEDTFDPAQHRIVSNASCTTNCLAPLAQVLNAEFGIAEALMTTVHAVTASQPTLDGINEKDFRSGRSVLGNIIPASTGAATAVGLVLPQLAGKLTGVALRVPTNNVSVVDLTVRTDQSTSYAAICSAMKAASESDRLGRFLGYTDSKPVSSDFCGCPYSSVFDASAGLELNHRFFKILGWYDNESGYANRLLDLVKHMAIVEGRLDQSAATDRSAGKTGEPGA